MSPTPFHRKAPGRKEAVASCPKWNAVMGRLGLSRRKPHLARRTSSELFFLSFFFFFVFFLKKKKVSDTATHEHAAGARGCSLQTELTAAQAHRESDCKAADSHGNLCFPHCAQCQKQLWRVTVPSGGLWRCPSQVGSPESELCHVLVNASTAGRPRPSSTHGSATAGHCWLGCIRKTNERKGASLQLP